MTAIEHALQTAVDAAWGPVLLVLLLGGGLILMLWSRFLPFFGARHALDVLRGRYDSAEDPGQITHFQALATALSATIGLGNISGVAIAITQGGPGAVFWMWMAAFVGMATKFFSCTLAVMYRGKDGRGDVQGGPMYYIEIGLGRRFRGLAILFSICGLIGCLGLFQANQVAGILDATYGVTPAVTGVASLFLVALVSFGGITRIGRVASRLVPAMCAIYMVGAVLVVIRNYELIPAVLGQIFHDAFTGTAAVGGAVGITWAQVVQTGVKRAAFSNEAGLGTAPMAHGAAKTTEPVREGLVAMLGPFVDTIVVCSLTAFVILSTGLWRGGEGIQGVTLTVSAFESELGGFGRLILVTMVVLFGFTTMIGNSYYGRKCFAYLFGVERARLYDVFYVGMLYVGAVSTVSAVVNLIDTAYALMAFPNMIATLVLAPRVIAETRRYFSRLDDERRGA